MERQRTSGAGFLIVIAGLVVFMLMQDHLVGRQAPDFSLHEAYGGQVQLESYRGHPVLLVFWTTSCGVCRHELPALDRIASDFQSKGVAVVAINVGDLDGARQFMRESHINSLTNLVDADGSVAQKYGVRAVPKLVLVGPTGKVQRANVGMQSDRTVRGWLESAVRS